MCVSVRSDGECVPELMVKVMVSVSEVMGV